MTKKSYFYFNCILAGIIISIFVYAGLFAYNSHAVHCVYKQTLGIDCPTCGLTRSFHNILSGNFKQAAELNSNSFTLFAFFLLQLIARIVLIFIGSTKAATNKIIKWDIIFSATLFVVCFWPLIIFVFRQ